MTPVALALALALVVVLGWFQQKTYAVQYVFFCRFPLLGAAVLLAGLPWLVLADGPATFVGNLVELSGGGVAVAAASAFLFGLAVRFAAARTLELVPLRTALPLVRAGGEGSGRARVAVALYRLAGGPWFCDGDAARGRRYAVGGRLASAALALPFVGVLVARSESDVGEALAGAALAAAVAVGWAAFADRVPTAALGPFCAVARRLLRFLVRDRVVARQAAPAAGPAASGTGVEAGAGCQKYPEDAEGVPKALVEEHAQAALFATGVFALFAGMAVAIRPGLGVPDVPPVAVVLLLLTFYVLALGLAAVVLDKLRVPVTLAALALYVSSYGLPAKDYTFDAARADGPAPTVRDVVGRWRAANPGLDTAVVVTVEGGGITAARWAAEVLTRLHDGVPSFARRTLFVSTVSGGGVGAAYYLDRWRPGPLGSDTTAVREASGRSSLYGAVYGLVAHDVWRVVPFFDATLGRLTLDRGAALEAVWRSRLAGPDARAGDALAPGTPWRPAQLFNATAVESGERVVAAPLCLPGTPTFATAFGPAGGRGAGEGAGRGACGGSVRLDPLVATAARLSSAFPFVSPTARPAPGLVPDAAAYHFADGGYFDNEGVTTALAVIDAALDTAGAGPGYRPPKAVVLVRIGYGGADPVPADSAAGWSLAALGPLRTLVSVRSTSQRRRNDADLGRYARAAGGAVRVVAFQLEAPRGPTAVPDDTPGLPL